MFDNLKDTVKQVDPVTYDTRIYLCTTCADYSKLLGNCKKCLCFVKVKAKFASEQCPLGKWK